MPRRSTSSRTGSPTGSRTGGSPGPGNAPGPGSSPTPRNRTPQPLPRRRRSFGDFVKAFLAFVALVGLLVGVPYALAVTIGWPFPDGSPSLDWLQEEITVKTFQNILGVIVWIAWAQFTACVLVEVKAALSGVGMPGRVPGAGPSQLLARQLVAALLLVGATAASFTPGLSQLGHSMEGNQQGTVASAQATPGGSLSGMFAQQQEQAASTAAALGQQAADAASHAEVGGPSVKAEDTKYYRIQPPEGRHHDSLWEIAQRHLGDGRRYGEIYQLNKDRVQPDGSRLSEASLIRPGWIMQMPGDARGGDLVEMPSTGTTASGTTAPDAGAAVTPQVAQQINQYAQTGDHAQQAGGGQRGGTASLDTNTTRISLGGQRSAPGASQATPAVTHEQHAAAETATSAESDAGFSFGLPEALLGAPLLAAGLLGALGRRRRQALWQSALGAVGGRRGMEPPTPTGAAADAQDALLIGADPEGVRLLDRSLRGLAASLAGESRALPTVYAAWLSNGDLHLQLAQPAGKPPAPWQLGQDQTFWLLARTDAERYEDVDTAAPYPGLVSLGTMDDSRLLLNLESVPGIVSLSGSESDRAAVFASVAAELATNGWSDRMTITLVGFGQDLTPLAPNRLRHLDDIEALVETMEAETRQRRGALGAAGHDSVLTGRTGPAQHTRWAPHLVLLAAEPSADDAVKLAELAADASRLGIGYLVGTDSGDLPGAAWEMEITSEGKLLAPLLGLELDAQVLPVAQQRAVVELFVDADPEHAPDGPATTPPFLVDISEQGRPAVYARLVGPYEIIGLDTPDGERSPLQHEALALLLLHREGVHPRVLSSALWPRGVTDDVREALLDRLRVWLGTDPDGTPRLATDANGRLMLAKSVVSDLDVLRSLYHEATQGKGVDSRVVRGRLLTDALALVRGPLLADRAEGRYGWLTHEIIDAQLPLLVADIGLALAEFHLVKNRAERAIEALAAALNSAPGDERLWHELLRATHATGDTDKLQQVAADLIGRSGARGLPPRTEALLDELLPTWRDGAAAAG
ncbi:BTAD domain-containing putative transcriptional regulator [Streptomyces turgidiscabies]|uniref:BTAD domain-containing putative transcriptional regulator n=1 Tax=Streptomyces TaxID=1883 RepID=UPI00076E8CCA|nr:MULTISPECIES: BTAD domain-containing putative transcriptional regulator [Streptomyces]MDX3495741.1 BTAD domain-containing putative transcriptional regulator [Streptomyces turgidiscabies]GAQ75486.1 bacterial transcriptional activator domain [Streptomyces turgidiscabies]